MTVLLLLHFGNQKKNDGKTHIIALGGPIARLHNMCPFLIRDLDNCRADQIFFGLPHSLCQALTEVSSTELVGAASSATSGTSFFAVEAGRSQTVPPKGQGHSRSEMLAPSLPRGAA